MIDDPSRLPEDGRADRERSTLEHMTSGDVAQDGNVRRTSHEILEHLVALRALGWRHAMALKDGRNHVAMLERETARGRSAQEQFLAVTLSGLNEAQTALRGSEAERAALTERLHVTTGRNRRLTTRCAALAADLRAKTVEADDARREGDVHIQGLAARVSELEARLVEADAAVAVASRREADLRSERTRSRWLRLGRVLKMTKL